MKIEILVLILGILITSIASMVSAVTIEDSSIFPTEIEAGQVATLSIRLQNNLNKDVEDVSVSLDLSDAPFAPYESSNEVTIEELSENEDDTITFKIVALSDSESGIYKIPVKISYFDEDRNSGSKDALISITLNSEPELAVEIEDSLLLKGQEGEITLRIVNKGLSDAKFLDIEIGNSNYYTILSKENVYIGNIDSDDFDSAKFKLYFKESVPSRVNLPVVVSYRDAVNNRYVDEMNIQLDVYSRERAIELGLLQQKRTGIYIGIAIVLIIGYLIYRRIKKRRKQKKLEK